MNKVEFEKKKSIIVRNGLSLINGLKDTFEALLKHDWYEKWEYPDNLRKINGTTLEPLEINILFEKIRNIISDIAKYPDKFESLWEKGLK